jgi:hypothetical protein
MRQGLCRSEWYLTFSLESPCGIESYAQVQSVTMGHRDRKTDPFCRCRRLLTKADDRLTDHGQEQLLGLLHVDDPDDEVANTWQAKEAIRALYSHTNAELALTFVERLGKDMKEADNPIEV